MALFRVAKASAGALDFTDMEQLTLPIANATQYNMIVIQAVAGIQSGTSIPITITCDDPTTNKYETTQYDGGYGQSKLLFYKPTIDNPTIAVSSGGYLAFGL